MPTSATASTGRITSRMKKKVRRLRKLTWIPRGEQPTRAPAAAGDPATIGWPSRADLLLRTAHRGAIAQLGERLDRTQEAAGSSPASSIAGIPHGYWVCALRERGDSRRISSRERNIQSAHDL